MQSNIALEKTAVICGVSGQHGSYLAQFLLRMGCQVWGTSRDAQRSSMCNLAALKVLDQVRLLSMVPEDFRSFLVAIERSSPAEIYYLAGQSSVGLSFEQPAETMQSTVIGTLNVLEACRMFNRRIRLYHADSSECVGDTNGKAATEEPPFSPRSPYEIAKAPSFWLVNSYREAYGEIM